MGGEALIIDPVLDQVERYLVLLKELINAINTHVHADQIGGLGTAESNHGQPRYSIEIDERRTETLAKIRSVALAPDHCTIKTICEYPLTNPARYTGASRAPPIRFQHEVRGPGINLLHKGGNWPAASPSLIHQFQCGSVRFAAAFLAAVRVLPKIET